MNSSKNTKILWHYTSISNAVNILTTRELWATHCDFLNDTSEVRVPLKHFLDRVKSKGEENFLKDLGLLDNWEEYLRSNCTINAFYILSFSSTTRSLPLWTTYTPNGGCAIGFDKMKLFDYFNRHSISVNNPALSPIGDGLFRVYYTTTTGKNPFETMDKKIDSISERMKQIMQEEKEDPHINHLHPFYGILQSFVATKDSSFSFEKEYRFVFVVEQEILKNERIIFFNNGKPFIKVKLPPITDCVTEIKLSPHGNHNLSREALKFAQSLVEYKEGKEGKEDCFKITQSQSPYRKPEI